MGNPFTNNSLTCYLCVELFDRSLSSVFVMMNEEMFRGFDCVKFCLYFERNQEMCMTELGFRINEFGAFRHDCHYLALKCIFGLIS